MSKKSMFACFVSFCSFLVVIASIWAGYAIGNFLDGYWFLGAARITNIVIGILSATVSFASFMYVMITEVGP